MNPSPTLRDGGGAAALAGLREPSGDVLIDHEQFGDGYGAPTDSCLEAMRVAARTEGLLLDPVYMGKALAGLIAAAREERITADLRVVFLHTVGLPALFTDRYAVWLKG